MWNKGKFQMLPKVKTKNSFPHLSSLDKPTRTANHDILHSWFVGLYVLMIANSHFRFCYLKQSILFWKIIFGENDFPQSLWIYIRASKSSIFRCVEKQNILIYSSWSRLFVTVHSTCVYHTRKLNTLNDFKQNIVICQWVDQLFPEAHKSLLTITHEQEIICSQTHFGGIMPEKTIICGQLFADLLCKHSANEKEEKLHGMMKLLTCCYHPWIWVLTTLVITARHQF